MSYCQTCHEKTPSNDALMFNGECLACHSFRCDSDDCFSMQCFEIRWFGTLDDSRTSKATRYGEAWPR